MQKVAVFEQKNQIIKIIKRKTFIKKHVLHAVGTFCEIDINRLGYI